MIGCFKEVTNFINYQLIFTFPTYLTIGFYSCCQKNIHGGLKVLKEMKHANVKPDSETFSYLIFNCGREEDIIKVCRLCIVLGISFKKLKSGPKLFWHH